MSFPLLFAFFSPSHPRPQMTSAAAAPLSLPEGKPSVGCAFVRNSPGGTDDGEVFLDICVALKMVTCRESTGPFLGTISWRILGDYAPRQTDFIG